MTPNEQLLAARTGVEVLAALHRGWHVKTQGEEPDDPDALTPKVLADWLPECPAADKEAASALFVETLRHGNHDLGTQLVINGTSGESDDNAWSIDRLQAEWLAIPDADRPKFPLLPLVDAWEWHKSRNIVALKRVLADPESFYRAVDCDAILEALAPWKPTLLHDDPTDMASASENIEGWAVDADPAKQPIFCLTTTLGRLKAAMHSNIAIVDADRLDAAHYWLPDNEATQSTVAMRARDNALTLKPQLQLIDQLEEARKTGNRRDVFDIKVMFGMGIAIGAGIARTNASTLIHRLALLPESPTGPPPPEGVSLLDRLVMDKWPLPPSLKSSKVTVAGSGKRGMTRRVQIVSTVRRVGWTPDEGRPGAIVDGEPVAAAVPDWKNLFPERKRLLRRQFAPGEQRLLAFPTKPSIPMDLRLLALQDVSANPDSRPVLPGDLLTILTFAHLADAPIKLHQHQGAALLVRNREGQPRPVQPQHDYGRFWEASYWLRTLVLWEPNGGYRWVDMATVEVPEVKPVEYLTIGPPAWARGPNVGKWTLTAEGSVASLVRVTAGRRSLAGRIVTGLEYLLAAGFSGKPNTVAPYLRPEHPRRAASPGPAMFVSWRNCLFGAGDWWDVTNEKADKAALSRFDRAVAPLEQRGYFVGEDLRHEAPAGDSVEIICRRRGARGRPGGLIIRASARFVEAARLAQLPHGTGFEPVLLTDYTGLEAE